MDDGLLRVEHLAHVDGDLRLFVFVRQHPQMARGGADADHAPEIELPAQFVLDLAGDLVNLGVVILRAGQLLDQDQVRLVHAQDEILLPVGEHLGDRLQRGQIRSVDLTDQEHGAGNIRGEMQLLGADINVAGQDVVRNDVLYEDGFVVLLLIVDPGLLKGHAREDAHAARRGVSPVHKDGVIGPGVHARHGLIGPLPRNEHLLGVIPLDAAKILQLCADHAQFAAGYDHALVIRHADAPVGGVLHLNDDTLKYSAGHKVLPLMILSTCTKTESLFYVFFIIVDFCAKFNRFFVYICK